MPVPNATIDPDPRGKLLDLETWGFALNLSFFGVVGGLMFGIAPVLKTGGDPTMPIIVGLVGGVVVVPLLYVAARGLRIMRTRYEFYDDRIVVNGPWISRADYDDIAVAVRLRTEGDKSIDAASFELVREDAANLRIEHAPDPRQAEQLLNTYLAPEAWIERHEGRDTALHVLVQRWLRRHRRYLQDADRDTEATPSVIDDGVFEEWTDIDPADATLRLLDQIDDVDDVSDIDAGDLEGAGDGDGGADGDGGGGGGAE